MNAEVVFFVVMGVVCVVAILGYLIHELAKVRLEEVRLMKQSTLAEEDLDRLAEKLAHRLARPGEDRRLLLDLAKMSEDEFRAYREALLGAERAAGPPPPPDRKRELG